MKEGVILGKQFLIENFFTGGDFGKKNLVDYFFFRKITFWVKSATFCAQGVILGK